MRSTRRTAGLTLVELMIALAIIGILSATSISVFRYQQNRSKRAEAMTNVEAISKNVRGYFGELGLYPGVDLYWPAAPIGPRVNWDLPATTAFGPTGFRIDGGVYYRYDVSANAPIAGLECAQDEFTVIALSDLDGDTNVGAVGFFHPGAAGTPCPYVFGLLPPLFPPFDGGGNRIVNQTVVITMADDF